MNTAELESILEGNAEAATLDFKAASDWSVKLFVKDILAMSNCRDGGRIIVGVKEAGGSFVREGVSDAQKVTYVLDHIRDQIDPFADPHVRVSVEFPVDKSGLQYVVLNIAEFDQSPTICAKDGHDVSAGIVYFRSDGGRPASAPVRSAHDMRQILERATVRLMGHFRNLGLAPTAADDSVEVALDKELGGL